MHKYTQFVARTVLVKNNNIEEGMRVINRIMGKEGLFNRYRLTRYYEKPYQIPKRPVSMPYSPTFETNIIRLCLTTPEL
ncbi:small ribosomal subunit protein bS21m isoform X2 [Panulirus ornatus]|uniref:small ribosomal subunit protein bS21m isoform X2 n=1 Tax=Panulirus ornatus TaxID=150431 RepID=UPI003A85C9F5